MQCKHLLSTPHSEHLGSQAKAVPAALVTSLNTFHQQEPCTTGYRRVPEAMRTPGVQPSPGGTPETSQCWPGGSPAFPSLMDSGEGTAGGQWLGSEDGSRTWCEGALCLRMTSLDWAVWRLALLTMRLTLSTLQAAKTCQRLKDEAEKTSTGRCKVVTETRRLRLQGPKARPAPPFPAEGSPAQ